MKKIVIFAAIILVGLALFESEATAIPSDTDTVYRFSFVDVYGTTGGSGVVTGEIYGLHWDSLNMQATHILITSSPFTSETIDATDPELFPSQAINYFTTSAGVVIDGGFSACDNNGASGNALSINAWGFNLFTFGEQYRKYVWGNRGLAAANFVDDTPPDTAPVPEPTTMLLLGLGLIGVAGIRRKLNI